MGLVSALRGLVSMLATRDVADRERRGLEGALAADNVGSAECG